jgi:glycosyltransferase involved in cell wall biosynthesis
VRIVHLSTGHLGGAGLAARRLNAGLQALGVKSSFFALENPTYLPQKGEYEIARSVIQRVETGITTFTSKRLTKDSLVTPVSANLLDREFLLFESKNEKTIFHIHNWFNIFSHSQLAELSREFQLVLTLHDQRLFTGACHYSLGCQKFKTDCARCPQLPRVFENIPSKTLESDLDFSRVSFVTPSNWLMNLAKSSKLLKDSSGLVISNSFYGYESHVEDHKEIGPAINVGFAAMDPKSWIKGGDIVSSLIQKTSGEGKYKFLALTDFKNYADFWSSIDVLLVPSRADNSPNVIHEAKLWGIPVVTSNIGGIPEIIDESFDSALSIDEFTIERIVFEIEKVVEKSGDKQLKKNVSQNHKAFLDMSIDKHIELYRSLLD